MTPSALRPNPDDFALLLDNEQLLEFSAADCDDDSWQAIYEPCYAHFATLQSISVRNANSKPDHPVICHGFYHDGNLNAFAGRSPSGRYYTAMSKSAPPLLFDYFSRALANPEVLPRIGGVGVEDPPRPPVHRPKPNAWPSSPDESSVNAWTPELRWPKCPDRALTARVLTEFGLMFIYGHELAHVRFGHIGFANDLQANAVLLEGRSSKRSPPLSPLTSQTLEMNADSYGTHLLVRGIDGALKTAANREAWIAQFGSEREVYEATLFALYTTIRLIHTEKLTIDESKVRTHPHPLVRQEIIAGVMMKLLQDLHVERSVVEEFRRNIPSVVQHAEFTLDSVFDGIAWFALSDAVSGQVTAQIDEYLNHWQSIRVALIPHALSKNVVP